MRKKRTQKLTKESQILFFPALKELLALERLKLLCSFIAGILWTRGSSVDFLNVAYYQVCLIAQDEKPEEFLVEFNTS